MNVQIVKRLLIEKTISRGTLTKKYHVGGIQ
jgi:hypothetical protein